MPPLTGTATLVIERTWAHQPVPPAAQVTVTVRALAEHLAVEVDAPWHGDPPPPGPPASTPGLWGYEVVELMLLGADHRYLEVELSPHGHWLVLSLAGVRQVERQGHPLAYRVRRLGGRWQGVAAVPWAWLPPGCDRLNAFAIHGQGEGRQYLAWRPAGGAQPDFHQLGAFGAWPG